MVRGGKEEEVIRPYQKSDYLQVSDLLSENGFVVPTPEELGGQGFVWEQEGEILGFILGLTGPDSATVFVDYFVVKEEARKEKDDLGRGLIAASLVGHFLIQMKAQGKTRVVGQLYESDINKALAKIYNRVGIKFDKPYLFFSGNISDILVNMMEGRHGK